MAKVDIAAETQALPLGYYLSAPLTAAIEAQGALTIEASVNNQATLFLLGLATDVALNSSTVALAGIRGAAVVSAQTLALRASTQTMVGAAADNAVAGRVPNATAHHDDLIGGVFRQRLIGRNGQGVVKRQSPSGRDRITAQRPNDEVRSKLNRLGTQGLVDEKTDWCPDGIVRLPRPRDMIGDARPPQVRLRLMRPNSHALIRTGAPGHQPDLRPR